MHFDEKYVKSLLPKRPENSHKGTFGSALNIAGSKNYPGAAYFSSVSALKVGCGLSTLFSEESVLNSVSSLSPDIILMRFKDFKKRKSLEAFQAISIGCGLSVSKNSAKLFTDFLIKTNKSQTPVIIDADGLNILALGNCKKINICGKSEEQDYPQINVKPLINIKLPANTILTPHPKELSRLMCVNVENILLQPEFWAKMCSDKYNCTTVLKMHKTIVADEKGHIYTNNTGNSALAHGGSGDVLCGMITGFLAQGLNCFDASILAVYLHGLAAEIASKELSEYSVLSSNLLNYIPQAIKKTII